MALRKESAILRYGIAITAVTLCILLGQRLAPLWNNRYPFVPFYVAVMLAAWFGGMGPGLLATGLSCLAIIYLWLGPNHSLLALHVGDRLGLLMFALVGVVIVSLTEEIRHSRKRTQQDAARLREALLAEKRSAESATRAIEHLRESEERFRHVVDQAPIMVRMSGPDQASTYFNKAWLDFRGRGMEQELGQGWAEGVHPEDLQRWRDVQESAFEAHQPFEIEYRLRRADGEYRWVIDRGVPRYTAGGEFLGFIGSCLDITERKHGEAYARELAAIVESSDDAILGMTLEGQITSWNHGAQLMYGYTAEEMIGRPVSILAPPERVDDLGAMLEQLRRGERIEHYETTRVAKSGQELEVSLTVSPIRDGQGNIVGLSKIARDITERRRLEDRLRQSQKLESIGLLAGGVAHDFNNILTGILGNASLALEMLPPAHPAHNLLGELVRASERAAGLTHQLLAYAGKSRFAMQRLDISELIREISGLVRASIPRNVTLQLELGHKLPPIQADASQVHQLLMNLIINAAEATGEAGGLVVVTSSLQDVDESYIQNVFPTHDLVPGRYVAVEVHDTGCGMDAETQQRIFEPFFTTKFMGRGLGLAAVLGIVRGHRGAIKVYSTPGRGTTFKVLLPLAEKSGAPPAGSPAPAELRGEGTVLVVDDEGMVRQVAEMTLRRYGYDVLLARDGREAIEVFKRGADRITLVLLDMTLPVMSGEEVFSEMKKIQPEVRVIASSGYNQISALRRLSGKGLVSFLQKPYTAAQLAEAVKQELPVRD